MNATAAARHRRGDQRWMSPVPVRQRGRNVPKCRWRRPPVCTSVIAQPTPGVARPVLEPNATRSRRLSSGGCQQSVSRRRETPGLLTDSTARNAWSEMVWTAFTALSRWRHGFESRWGCHTNDQVRGPRQSSRAFLVLRRAIRRAIQRRARTGSHTPSTYGCSGSCRRRVPRHGCRAGTTWRSVE